MTPCRFYKHLNKVLKSCGGNLHNIPWKRQRVDELTWNTVDELTCLLHRKQLDFNSRLENIRDNSWVYIRGKRFEESYQQIDYVHGVFEGRPMAQMLVDEENISCRDLFKAGSDGWLWQQMTYIKRRWRSRVQKRIVAVCLALGKSGLQECEVEVVSFLYPSLADLLGGRWPRLNRMTGST